MKKFLFVLFLTATCLLAIADSHALYLATIHIGPLAEDRIEVQVKVFADDLQDVLRNYSEEFRPTSLDETLIQNQSLTESYFQENLSLTLNEKHLEISLKEGELENDAFVLVFQAASPKGNWKELQVVGDFFTELFPDQSNVLILRYEGNQQFERFTLTNTSSTFTFD